MNVLKRRVSQVFHKKSANAHLQKLKEWIDCQSDLQCKIDDHWLSIFLDSCEYDIDKTKAKIEMFYVMRYVMPEIFTNRDPRLPRVQQVLNLGLFVPFFNPGAETNFDTIVVRLTFSDPEKLQIPILLKVNLMIMDILLIDDLTQFKNFEFLVDLKNFSHKYDEQLSPNKLKTLLSYFEDSYPVKVKGVHFVNPPPYAMPLLNLFTLFVSEKNRSKIHIHCENEDADITQIFPVGVVPQEFGGTNSTFEEMRLSWKVKVESYRDWFLEGGNQYNLDMVKRPKDDISFVNPFTLD